MNYILIFIYINRNPVVIKTEISNVTGNLKMYLFYIIIPNLNYLRQI
jgi:hypothetical protein